MADMNYNTGALLQFIDKIVPKEEKESSPQQSRNTSPMMILSSKSND